MPDSSVSRETPTEPGDVSRETSTQGAPESRGFTLRTAGDVADFVAPLDDELLELDDDRPVLRADLDTRERADYLLKSGAPHEKVWEALGVEQDEIAEWRRILDERRANFNTLLDSDGETEL